MLAYGFDVEFKLSILDPPSSILHPLSSILYPPSSILYPPSSILYPLSSVLFFTGPPDTNTFPARSPSIRRLSKKRERHAIDSRSFGIPAAACARCEALAQAREPAHRRRSRPPRICRARGRRRCLWPRTVLSLRLSAARRPY